MWRKPYSSYFSFLIKPAFFFVSKILYSLSLSSCQNQCVPFFVAKILYILLFFAFLLERGWASIFVSKSLYSFSFPSCQIQRVFLCDYIPLSFLQTQRVCRPRGDRWGQGLGLQHQGGRRNHHLRVHACLHCGQHAGHLLRRDPRQIHVYQQVR